MKVSVFMITYNHEPYIRQALDSVLLQEFDGEWEIVIGEDCSTDATRSILLEYRAKYPQKIRLLLPEKNLGMMRNGIETYRACQGEYVAVLEGDDFWTSPHKLQKQVDFMAQNPHLSCSFHNIKVLTDGQENDLFDPAKMKKEYGLKDIVCGNFIPSCSIMHRKVPGEAPAWFESMPMGDWPTMVLNAQWGPIGYLDENMATYRVHTGGVWSTQKRYDILSSSIRAAQVINKHLNYRYFRRMGRTISMWKLEKALLMAAEKNYPAAVRDLLAAIASSPFNRKLYQEIRHSFIPSVMK